MVVRRISEPSTVVCQNSSRSDWQSAPRNACRGKPWNRKWPNTTRRLHTRTCFLKAAGIGWKGGRQGCKYLCQKQQHSDKNSPSVRSRWCMATDWWANACPLLQCLKKGTLRIGISKLVTSNGDPIPKPTQKNRFKPFFFGGSMLREVDLPPCRCFLKWWYPTNIGFPTKNDHFRVFWGYHNLRNHPCKKNCGTPFWMMSEFLDFQKTVGFHKPKDFQEVPITWSGWKTTLECYPNPCFGGLTPIHPHFDTILRDFLGTHFKG